MTVQEIIGSGKGPVAPEDQEHKKTYTPEEARHIIGVGRNLIYKMVRTGELRAVRAGARVLIPKTALDDFLNRGE